MISSILSYDIILNLEQFNLDVVNYKIEYFLFSLEAAGAPLDNFTEYVLSDF